MLFQDSDEVEIIEEEDNDVAFDLSFQYANFSFHYDSFAHPSSVQWRKGVMIICLTR